MKRLIRKHPILSFLVINYAISWTFLYPCYQLILKNDGFTPLALIGLVGGYGPTIAAILVQSVISKEGVRPLLMKLLKFRAGIGFYLFIILFPILSYMLAYLVSAILFDGDLTFSVSAGLLSIPFWFLVALPFGPMGEELGWRGFMLPKLLERFSVVKSTILIGLAWGIWHLASFTFPGAAIPSFLPVNLWTILLYFLYTISISFVFTYAHLKSGGSVWIAILLHAFYNAGSNIAFEFFAETESFNILFSAYVLNIVLAITVGYYLLARSRDRFPAY